MGTGIVPDFIPSFESAAEVDARPSFSFAATLAEALRQSEPWVSMGARSLSGGERTMINALEAVSNLVRPVAMQVLLARERLESGVAYNPVSDEVARDPYAVYRRLREKDPVHRMRLVDAWVLTRYHHADAMLRDHELDAALRTAPVSEAGREASIILSIISSCFLRVVPQ